MASVRIELEDAGKATDLGAHLQSHGYRVDVVATMVGPPDVLVRKPLLKRTDAFVRRLLEATRLWMVQREDSTALAVVAGDERYEFESAQAVEAALVGASR